MPWQVIVPLKVIDLDFEWVPDPERVLYRVSKLADPSQTVGQIAVLATIG